MCILRDLSPGRRTLGHYAPGELPNLICSHVPMEVFLFYERGKKKGKSKEGCLQKGRFLYLCVLLMFRNTLGFMPSGCPSLKRTHSYGNLPYIQL
jgi:hypothetical protein